MGTYYDQIRKMCYPKNPLIGPHVGKSSQSYLQQKLHHLRMHQSLDALSIHMGNEVPSLQSGLMGWAAFFHTLVSQCREQDTTSGGGLKYTQFKKNTLWAMQRPQQ